MYIIKIVVQGSYYFQCSILGTIQHLVVVNNRHHRVSQSVPFFMHCKTVTILLRIMVREHFVTSITKNHQSHYVTVLDNPPRKWHCPQCLHNVLMWRHLFNFSFQISFFTPAKELLIPISSGCEVKSRWTL